MDNTASSGRDDFAEDEGFVHEGKSQHAFRTISEVSQEIDVPQHVLRFWESKFAQIRPLKRGGGRRYYRPEDVELIRRIKNYLYNQGYTIKGVQRLLKDKKGEGLVAATPSFVPYASVEASLPPLPTAPIITQGSMLHAAAASPSALAMAYGAIAAQVQEGSQNIRAARFPDAFAEATTHIPAEENEAAKGQLAQSLEAVTKIYEDIAADIKPIRIINPAAPKLEDMPEEIVAAAPVIPEPEFVFEKEPAAPIEAAPEMQVAPVMETAKPQAEEAFDESEEEIDTDALLEVTEAVIARDEFSPGARQELNAILEELTALREMMRSALSA